MRFKEIVENNPFIWLAGVAVAAFSLGYGAREALLRDGGRESVLKGSYVLKAEIDNGASTLYIKRSELEVAQNRTRDLQSQLDATLGNLQKLKIEIETVTRKTRKGDERCNLPVNERPFGLNCEGGE